MTNPLFAPIRNIAAIRAKTGLNQKEFWEAVGVTQSGGSRFESGRQMSKPVLGMLRTVYPQWVET
ncbi:helix-turn-helix domain-containing protein [Chitinolyticbacter meiyuanensis]|uniref:helix-turn-helix domain-containing protein n=1 Tax=Chitinolyticbacter meiyuanensis TaxID=682798 RepID=UPI0011E5D69F|nr:hypothetical protein [Chitinolyticbacter meiyuanensis]